MFFLFFSAKPVLLSVIIWQGSYFSQCSHQQRLFSVFLTLCVELQHETSFISSILIVPVQALMLHFSFLS